MKEADVSDESMRCCGRRCFLSRLGHRLSVAKNIDEKGEEFLRQKRPAFERPSVSRTVAFYGAAGVGVVEGPVSGTFSEWSPFFCYTTQHSGG